VRGAHQIGPGSIEKIKGLPPAALPGAKLLPDLITAGLIKRSWLLFMETFANALIPRNEGRGHSQYGVQEIIPWLPEVMRIRLNYFVTAFLAARWAGSKAVATEKFLRSFFQKATRRRHAFAPQTLIIEGIAFCIPACALPQVLFSCTLKNLFASFPLTVFSFLSVCNRRS
jgi:hypothetical protein